MKKILKTLFLFLLFIPFVVLAAETCDDSKLVIESIVLDKRIGNIVELEKASISNKVINLGLNFVDADDAARYRLTIRNTSNEDYKIDESNLNINSDYFSYRIETEDGNNIVKAGQVKSVFLVVQYNTEIPSTSFVNGAYSDNKTVVLNLNQQSANQVINPETRDNIIVLVSVLAVALVAIIVLLTKKKQYTALLIIPVLGMGFVVTANLKPSRAICVSSFKLGVSVFVDQKPESENSYLMTPEYGEDDALFLRTNVVKKDIEKVIFTNSIAGHTVNGTDTFDVSVGENGSVLAWVTDEDSDGLYEVTIGANGKVFLSSGAYLFHRLMRMETIEGWEYLDTSQADNMNHMFFGCWSLKNIDLSHFKTAKVTTMIAMFGQCYGIKDTIDVSYLNTSNVTNMNGLFENCIHMKSIDISSFDFSKVTIAARMFWNNYELTDINYGHIDTSNVTTISGLYEGCWALESADLSIFAPAKINNTSYLFKDCKSIKNINISKLNTSEVTDMAEMFANCSALETLDISTMDTSKVTRMYQMFINSPNLTTIYASDSFVTDLLTESASDQNMFYQDESLVGGAGTTYDVNKPRGKTMAHIDGGESNPGYFTDKNGITD